MVMQYGTLVLVPYFGWRRWVGHEGPAKARGDEYPSYFDRSSMVNHAVTPLGLVAIGNSCFESKVSVTYKFNLPWRVFPSPTSDIFF